MHFGYNNQNIETSLVLIKYFDAFLGLVSLLYDSDVRRRDFYGKAGSFRLCEYGFEFRTLSSAMMATKELIEIVYNQVVRAINCFNNGGMLPDYTVTQTAINNGDVKLAKDLILKYKLI